MAESTDSSPRMRQLVDWSAAVWAGLIAGAVFLLLNLFLIPQFVGANAHVIIRLMASIVMGESILAPPATFHAGATVAAVAVHFTLSVLYSLVIAYIIHRWGLVVGFLGGAALGLALYAINFYTCTLFFPWFFALRNWIFVLTHAVYGALAGGIYEALEVEEFVPVDAPAS